MKFEHTSGGFTLPGESGQEKLTLELPRTMGENIFEMMHSRIARTDRKSSP